MSFLFQVDKTLGQNRTENGTSSSCVAELWRKIQRVLRKILEYERTIRIFVLISVIMSIAAAVLGFMNVLSTCETARNVSIFLVVKFVTAAFFWIIFIVLLCCKSINDALENAFYMCYLLLDNTFGLIWMIVGTIWVFYPNIQQLSECKNGIWNAGVYICVYVVVFLNWACVAAFLFLYGFIACDKNTYAERLINEDSSREDLAESKK